MAKNTYAIMGATGQIGSELSTQLLKKGHRVKAIGRQPVKLANLKKQGAEIVQVENFAKTDALTQAFKECHAVFSFLPPDRTTADYGKAQDDVGTAIKNAVQKNKVPYVLNLSSIGAHLAEGTGPIKGLHRHEERMNELADCQILHLRPNFFMENLISTIPLIKEKGMIALPLKADLAIQMVATKDIAEKAALFLDRLDFKGKTIFDLLGPAPVKMAEAAKTLGKTIDKPDLKYVFLPDTEAKKALVEAGLAPKFVELLLEMYKAFNEGLCAPTQKITEDHKGKTTFQEFATKTFKQAYHQFREPVKH